MKITRRQLILLLFVFGVFFLGLSFYVNYQPATRTSGSKIARVVRETGEVTWYSQGLGQRKLVTSEMEIGSFDSLETNDLGEATLYFENGYQVRVLPNTVLSLEKKTTEQNVDADLVLQHGNVEVEKVGSLGELSISKKGHRISASEYNESDLKRLQLPAKQPISETAAVDGKYPLSEQEISNVVSHHQTEFFKCYTHLLQKHPQARGEVILNFTIQSAGRVELPEVLPQWSQGTGTEEFNRCLKDVISRIEFRSFKGSSITTVFPLKFE